MFKFYSVYKCINYNLFKVIIHFVLFVVNFVNQMFNFTLFLLPNIEDQIIVN